LHKFRPDDELHHELREVRVRTEKLRHAAALALVGWYLMVPPYDGDQIHFDAPLSKWEVYSGEDSGRACEETKVDQWKREVAAHEKDDTLKRRLVHSQCISSDDPRLAK
jgi:hypothetical protein